MAGFFTWLWDWLLWMFWATEMDVTIVGLQNAGKTSLLRVLAVSDRPLISLRQGLCLLILARCDLHSRAVNSQSTHSRRWPSIRKRSRRGM